MGLVSIANLAGDEWTISNTRHNIITTDVWLDVALRRHRTELAALTADEVEVTYRIDGADVDPEIRDVRNVLVWLQKTYREAKTVQSATRPARYALLEKLAAAGVMPSEISTMVHVEMNVAERFAGSEHEARLARMILHNLRAT